jgi:hypothetical protein
MTAVFMVKSNALTKQIQTSMYFLVVAIPFTSNIINILPQFCFLGVGRQWCFPLH